MTADILVEASIAVGDDTEAGRLLIADVARYGVCVLLAKARTDHRRAKVPQTGILDVPAARGSEPITQFGNMTTPRNSAASK